MSLTKEEQDWVKENMREDFTVGFSEKLYFIHDKLVNTPSHVPGDEAESDGYFCMNCGKIKIPDVEEHAKLCMYFKDTPGDDIFILFANNDRQWLSGPFETIEKAVETAKASVPERASIIKLIGIIIKEETYEKREPIKGLLGEG